MYIWLCLYITKHVILQVPTLFGGNSAHKPAILSNIPLISMGVTLVLTVLQVRLFLYQAASSCYGRNNMKAHYTVLPFLVKQTIIFCK